MSNEDTIHGLIRKNLDEGLFALSPETARRLDAARQAALARQKPAEVQFAMAGNIELALGLWAFKPRVFGLLSLLVLMVTLLAFAHGQRHIHQIEELDSGILTDDLPLEAYLDKDFDRWLRRDPPF
jgi:hypothetical protein